MDQLGVVGVSFMFILLGLVFASIWLIAWGAFKWIWAWLQTGPNEEQKKSTPSSIWIRMMGWSLIGLILSVFILGMIEAVPQKHDHDHNQASLTKPIVSGLVGVPNNYSVVRTSVTDYKA